MWAKITLSYMRPGGVFQDAPEEFWHSLNSLMSDMPHYLDELESMITSNEIVLARTRGVGLLTDSRQLITQYLAKFTSFGVKWDLRKADPYEILTELNSIYLLVDGDTFDRYYVRILEMRESLKIITQCIEQIEEGPIRANTPYFIRPPVGEAYRAVEGPKGN
ncbi:MAG: hypothetical protein CM1200mP3_02070 [Chloroflexota bacterium]|nr:MAG: hypothetical protein CM1200mP3_02070 [Chloroflexota bacterium]